jgi:histone methylation protein DOT1
MTADLKQGGPTDSSAGPGLHFRRVFARHWWESVRYFGWWRSLREMAGAGWNALLELLLPSHRKARYGDLDYDWEHSVDTTRSNVGFGTQFLTGVTGRPYFATEPWLFQQMMQALPIDFTQFTFVDLGSGKGRVLLMASDYPFKRIIGVEFMPELHRVAQENIRKYTEHRTAATLGHFCGTGTPACAAGMVKDGDTDKSVSTPAGKDMPAGNPGVCATKAASIESLCMDARDFQLPDDPLVVYLFNPFSESTFAQVLENLRRSVLTSPRPMFIGYRYPEFGRLLDQSDWLNKVVAAEQWCIYQAISAARHRPTLNPE